MRARRTAAAAALSAGLLLGAGLALPAPAGAQDDGSSFLDETDPCPPGVPTPPAPFPDRAAVVSPHELNVDCAVALDIFVGGSTGNLDPASSTRRDQMASLIVRSLNAAGYTLPAATDQGFTDIAGNAHAEAINQLAAAGITLGTTATTYTPDLPVQRDQMASFVLRAAEFAFGDDAGFDATVTGQFADVPPANVHRDNIDAAAEVLRLTLGVAGGQNFDPAGLTRRDQMATFVVRLVDLILIPG